MVLYAPTWRDNQVYANGRRYRFDMRLDLERAWRELGEDHVFLIRGHHHMADDVPAGMRDGFALNVTAYPDITELYLVSDVLVTDYSSAMFDYAVTGRPILFFTYDLAEYRDSLRGFYFDFEAEAPGPLLADSAERDRGHPGRRRRRRRAPRRLPALHGPVLLPGRRQGRRPRLRPRVRLLTGCDPRDRAPAPVPNPGAGLTRGCRSACDAGNRLSGAEVKRTLTVAASCVPAG